MSEPKRVHFETISGTSSRTSNATATPMPKQEKSIRLELKLFEPNADTFAQFNYNKLCRAEKVSIILYQIPKYKFIAFTFIVISTLPSMRACVSRKHLIVCV